MASLSFCRLLSVVNLDAFIVMIRQKYCRSKLSRYLGIMLEKKEDIGYG
jgi:hypothetical protein